MKTLIQVVLLLLLANSITAQKLTPQQWIEDIDYLKEELPKKHKNLYYLKSPAYFSEQIEKIKLQVPELNDFSIAVKLQQVIASMGDTHTSINLSSFFDRSKDLQLHLFWFKDGLYVLYTTPAYKILLGKRIQKINGFSISTISDSLSTMIYPENKALIKKEIPRTLVNTQLLNYFGFINEAPISLEVTNGKETSVVSMKPEILDRSKRVHVRTKSISAFWKNEKQFFTDYYLPKSKTYVVQYNKCFSREHPFPNMKNADRLPSFKAFENRVLQTIQQNEVEKLVFDLRLNGGGNSTQGTHLIQQLAALKNINQKGKLFIILGRWTFSSAIINAMDFKNGTEAIFVGEETSGRPNHFGEVRNFQLPNSKLIVNFSTKYFRKYDTDAPTLKPDIYAEESFDAYVNGIDPALEAVLNYK